MGTLFYFVIKSILEGDRRERLAQAKWEKEQQSAAHLSANSRVVSAANPDPNASPDISPR
jgi:hypothetical protein